MHLNCICRSRRRVARPSTLTRRAPRPPAGTTFKLPRKYQFLKLLGKGAYGVVIACKNLETGGKVAVKKITPMSATATDGKHTLREIRLCRWLGKHPNIISLKDVIVDLADDTLYVALELYDTDLHKIIQSPQPLGDAHLKHFLYQLLRGLYFAHQYGVIHRDLKPANLVRPGGAPRASRRALAQTRAARAPHARTPSSHSRRPPRPSLCARALCSSSRRTATCAFPTLGSRGKCRRGRAARSQRRRQ